jgi:trk system potassium uptake protein TrkA
MVAKKTGNCRTIARVRDPEYRSDANFLKDELGLAMVINPEYAAAAEIDRLLRFPAAVKIDTFAKGKVELIKFKIPESSPLIDLSVKEIATVLKCDVLICTVERNNEVYITKGDFKFEEKDFVSLIATPQKAADFFEKIKHKRHSVKDVMILGGGKITQYLCEMLEKRGSVAIKIIEEDRKLCDYLCTQFPSLTIINGDPVERNILLEEGVSHAGAFISITDQDEENILLSLFAKNVSKAKLITKISRTDFDEVIKPLDLDSVIVPKNITADMILQYVRSANSSIGSNVETLYNLINGEVEAAEFAIKETSEITGKPLFQLHLKDNILIASILRNKNVIIPRGNDVITPGDRVIVVSKNLALHDINDILK